MKRNLAIKILLHPNTSDINFVSWIKIFFFSMIALYTMQPYFFWNKTVFQLFFAACVILCFIIQNSLNEFSERIPLTSGYVILFLLLFFTHWHFFKALNIEANIFGIFGKIIFWFPPVLVFFLSTSDEKKVFLVFFTNIMAVLLFVSLLAFFFVLLGGHLPSTRMQHPESKFYDFFENYKFFIVVHDKRNFSIFARFQSVFTEPGHLSMMTALLLYANDYKIKKWQNFVILISLIFTFSLAGYVLLIAGVFLYSFAISKRKLPMVLLLIFIGCISIGLMFFYYNRHPDSLISRTIISRLMPDEERGFSGNNRNTTQFKDTYREFIRENSFRTLTGWGNSIAKEFPKGGNSSYKNFIYENGFIGFFLLWIMYFAFTLGTKSFLPISFLFLFMLSFWQRPYAIWLSQMFIFMAYCAKYTSPSEIRNQNC